MQREMRNSNACLKVRCEQNLSSQWRMTPSAISSAGISAILAENRKFFTPPSHLAP